MKNPEITGKKQDTKFKKGVSGNPAGKPKGTISILTDLKRRLREIKKKDPDEYKRLIDDYWQDKRKRELLIKMIDGLPRQPVDLNSEHKTELKIILSDERDSTPLEAKPDNEVKGEV